MGAAEIFKQQQENNNDEESQMMTLPTGWEVLGLTKEKAQSIFDELADQDFQSSVQQVYGGARQKYDSKGRKVDSDGNLIDEKDKEEAEREKESSSDTGDANVLECDECGYTLFVVKGREFKFFPESFTCPECGCGKDKFTKR